MAFLTNNWKKISLLVVLVIALAGVVLGISQARSFFSKASGSNVPKNVNVSQISETSALVSWQTDAATQGGVQYGINANSLLAQARETTATTSHQVLLAPLLSGPSGTPYYYQIISGEDTFDSRGKVQVGSISIPYTFTTKGSAPSPSPTPSLAPSAGTGTWTLKDFQAKFGTSDPNFDLNKDGVVNGTDWSLYLKKQK